MRRPWWPSVQSSGSEVGALKLCRRVMCVEREGRREGGMGGKRISSKALWVGIGVSFLVFFFWFCLDAFLSPFVASDGVLAMVGS